MYSGSVGGKETWMFGWFRLLLHRDIVKPLKCENVKPVLILFDNSHWDSKYRLSEDLAMLKSIQSLNTHDNIPVFKQRLEPILMNRLSIIIMNEGIK